MLHQPSIPVRTGAPGSVAKVTWSPGWLRAYNPSWLARDAVAGLTLAAYLVPSGIADASLANLPPEAGLYACLLAGLVFWIFASSRHTVISVTSAISLLVGASLAEISGGDPGRAGALAAATALLVAGIAFLAWLVRAGGVVNFISESVMIGFKCGVALFLASTQLPKLLGLQSGHGSFWERCAGLFSQIHDVHWPSAMLGVSALAVLVVGKIVFKHRPVALFVVVGGIILASVAGLEGRGVKLLGEVPRGLPPIAVPDVRWSDLNDLLPLAMACFLLGAVETTAIGRMFAPKHGYRFVPNREFLALAGANLASGLGSGFPVSGGMSQSLVNESGGARTPLSGLFASLVILAVLVFFSGLLRDLPQPVLAAVVLAAVSGLFNVSALRHLRRSSRTEYVVALAALAGVLCSGLLRGVLVGTVISLVLLVRRAAHPHVARLGRMAGSGRFADMERHPDAEAIPGVMVVRPESGLAYFNIDQVCDRLRAIVGVQAEPPLLLLIDLSNAPYVDMQSAHTLASLADELAGAGIRVLVVEARAAVRDRFEADGLAARLGGASLSESVAGALERLGGGVVGGRGERGPDDPSLPLATSELATRRNA